MSARPLLIVTALGELPAGGLLLVAPSSFAALLLGAGLGSQESLLVARIAGAALVAIGLSCALLRNQDRGGTPTGLIAGLLAYNVSVAVLLTHAAVVDRMHGIALWPVSALHALLALWCVACLRGRASAAATRRTVDFTGR